MIAALLLLALPATFNGATWQDAAPCDDLAGDLTYSVRAVVVVPPGTAASPTGRAVYAAASSTSSSAYVYLGFPDGLLVPSVTHRSGSTFYTTKGAAPLANGPHTLCAVADGTLLRLYVDGALVSPGGGVPLSGAQPAARGLCTYGALRRSSGTSSYWVGEIRSARTWDRALTPAELASECGSAPLPPVGETCHGHTSLTWDTYTDPLVTHFEVERSLAGLNAWSVVGDTRPLPCPAGTVCSVGGNSNRPAVPDEYPAIRAGSWDVLRALPMPLDGVTYVYRVRAVRGAQKSEPSNVVDCGPQDPTRVYP